MSALTCIREIQKEGKPKWWILVLKYDVEHLNMEHVDKGLARYALTNGLLDWWMEQQGLIKLYKAEVVMHGRHVVSKHLRK